MYFRKIDFLIIFNDMWIFAKTIFLPFLFFHKRKHFRNNPISARQQLVCILCGSGRRIAQIRIPYIRYTVLYQIRYRTLWQKSLDSYTACLAYILQMAGGVQYLQYTVHMHTVRYRSCIDQYMRAVYNVYRPRTIIIQCPACNKLYIFKPE